MGLCTYCGGDNRSAPCAFPSSAKPGCLRTALLPEYIQGLMAAYQAEEDTDVPIPTQR